MHHNVESLREKWLESGDDAIIDILKQGDEELINRALAPGVNTLKEKVALPRDAHFVRIVNHAGQERERNCLHVSGIDSFGAFPFPELPIAERDDYFQVLIKAYGEIRGAVLVSIGELVDKPNGVILTRPFWPLIRLKGFDYCNCLGRDTLKVVFNREAEVGWLSKKNGECPG